jgi:hypothetical protein
MTPQHLQLHWRLPTTPRWRYTNGF